VAHFGTVLAYLGVVYLQEIFSEPVRGDPCEIRGRSRGDLGEISVRSRRDLGEIRGRSRGDVGEISGRPHRSREAQGEIRGRCFVLFVFFRF
jgi:hypothetical protein